MRNKILSVLVILFGALSFLIFVPGFFWAGLVLAIAGVIVGSATLKTLHLFSVIGIVLSLIACIFYMAMMGSAGVSIFG
ncbi:hypothetical protein [Christensenella intestinihominis]|uniref:hypothetical protein n=1 Tax=Christensenella intestinihominis TaxID=1851429 RepID=UPI00082E90F0|nr:hypothetical protein [Christensenella intestinihominis]